MTPSEFAFFTCLLLAICSMSLLYFLDPTILCMWQTFNCHYLAFSSPGTSEAVEVSSACVDGREEVRGINSFPAAVLNQGLMGVGIQMPQLPGPSSWKLVFPRVSVWITSTFPHSYLANNTVFNACLLFPISLSYWGFFHFSY